MLEALFMAGFAVAAYYALRRWVWGAPGASGEHLQVAGDGSFSTEVVGESRYQRTLEHIVGGKTDESAEHRCTALLSFEPTNPHDRNAVLVLIDGTTVGYLNRNTAKAFGRWAVHHGAASVSCPAMVVGGWKRRTSEGSFGVVLDLPRLG